MCVPSTAGPDQSCSRLRHLAEEGERYLGPRRDGQKRKFIKSHMYLRKKTRGRRGISPQGLGRRGESTFWRHLHMYTLVPPIANNRAHGMCSYLIILKVSWITFVRAPNVKGFIKKQISKSEDDNKAKFHL